MNKFIVYGHEGWIGQQVTKLLDDMNINYVCGQARVNERELLENEIKEIKPTHIICLIGRTHGRIDDKEYTTIDYLEQPGKISENVRDNLYAPLLLAILSTKYDYHLTYMGTGCIFKFDDDHPFGEEINGFNEDSKPNFFGSGYSIVKGYTDQLMHMYEESVLNVRIRMPITADLNKRNFITKITTYEKICSIPNSMSVLPELLPMMIDMAMNKKTGTINLTNPGLISHNEILEMYKEIADPSFAWHNFSEEEQSKILAAGRSNNFLNTDKLKSLYPNVKNIRDSVREIMRDIKNSI